MTNKEKSDSTGRTIIITGGSKGIGRALCVAFASAKTKIYFNFSNDEKSAVETERLVKDAGGTAVGSRVNVTAKDEVKTYFSKITEDTGRIDILINNAGITRDGLLARMKEKDWDDVLNVNLKGVFNCTKMAYKPMIKQRYGRIINISSVVGVTGNPGQANYVASKAGIIGFTKAMAKELASRNITVNAVAPGYIDTDMTKALTPKAREAIISQIPLGRTGRPGDVTAAVAYLASDSAAYITGQVIHVSGGMYM